MSAAEIRAGLTQVGHDIQPSPFVGREDECKRLAELFAAWRLVTVVGPPGVGKTRLATEFAARRAGPVSFCDLSTVAEQAGFITKVAGVLDLTLGPDDGADPSPPLGRALASLGPLFLVLDNFESVVTTAAELVGRWLAMAPELQVLVTSRERLQLTMESVHELGPLVLPGGRVPLEESPAVLLFLSRARTVNPAFTLDADSRLAVDRLVTALDGLPLAIELAASQLDLLRPQDLLVRISEQLDILGREARDVPVRSATLRGAIDHSWRGLTPAEQEAFRQLGVFEGGLSVEAATEVLRPPATPAAPPLIRILRRLVQKSLLRLVTDPDATAGAPRLCLYESLRLYACERLAEAGGEAILRIRERHRAYFASLARELCDGHNGPWGRQVRERLEADEANLVAALQHALGAAEAGDLEAAEHALQILVAMEPLFLSRGHRGHVPLIDRTLAIVEAAAGVNRQVDAGWLATALITRATALRRLGKLDDADASLARALGVAQGHGLPAPSALALLVRGVVASDRGRLDVAQEMLEEARSIAAGIDGPILSARVEINLGAVLVQRGDLEQADRRLETGLRLCRETGYRQLEGGCHHFFAERSFVAGDLEGAAAALRTAITIHLEVHNRQWESHARLVLGAINQLRGRVETAAEGYERGLALCELTHDLRWHAMGLAFEASLAHQQRRYEDAVSRYDEALAQMRPLWRGAIAAFWCGARGAAAASSGDVSGAARAFAEAEALLEGDPDETVRSGLDLYRAQLDVALARQASERGAPGLAALHRMLAGLGLDAQARPRAKRYAHLPQLDEARFPLLLLWQTLGGEEARSFASGPSLGTIRQAAAERTWLVAASGEWFVPPGAEVVELASRKPVRRILRELAFAQVGGRTLRADRLIAQAWPGEWILEDAAQNRLRVAVSTLRRFGLGEVVLTADGSYGLAPDAAVLIVPPWLPRGNTAAPGVVPSEQSRR